ncbi:MAG TPA: LacI family DNA-binding transcriptional regulator, partial [Aggregatilineales bacterium]|nr:LacI family DNA-binding transcriptional regulator [Aggregatilineales bacterium]
MEEYDSNNGQVTQSDVAKHAGVSRAVVSYVINNGPRQVSPDTRRRVLEAIRELGYRPNEHAQRLKQGSDFARKSVGVVIGGKSYQVLARSYYNQVMVGLF